jgi:imidazolonepropionase-like amidohydrolase
MAQKKTSDKNTNRSNKAASWDPAKKRAARKARRKAANLAYKHGIRTGQLKKSTASADS